MSCTEGDFERIDFRALGGPCALHLRRAPGVDLRAVASAAIAEVRRIEAKYSRYRDDSVVSRINAAAGTGRGVDVDDETAALLDYATLVYRESGGLFDATSGVLRRAWNFRSGRLPEQREIAALLPLVGWSQVEWRRPQIALPRAGMQLDFGGFGKEYAVDRAAEACRAAGAGQGVVDLAGDLVLIRALPVDRPFRVGVRDPRNPERAAASVALCAGAIATSGDYERSMSVGGRRYSHLLDPRSGWPVERGLASVSVIAERCLIAGSASTIAMLSGERAGTAFLDALGLPSLRIHADGRIGGRLAESQRGGAANTQRRAGPRVAREAA